MSDYDIKSKAELELADEIYESLTKPKQKRGFALLTPEQRKAVAASGGKGVPAHKRAFSVSYDLAASAGRKGGTNSHGGGRRKKC